MKKKFLFALLLSVLLLFFMTYSFANNTQPMQDTANSIRDMVGGAENAMEDAAGAVSNTSKNITGDMQEGLNNVMNGNESNDAHNDNTDSGNYTAQRTSTSTDGTMAGMNSTTWIWLIMAILAVAIIALVYYYSAELAINNRNNYHNDDE